MQGGEGDLAHHAPLLEDLDLSCNLLWQWSEIERLCQELSQLHVLNLSGNTLQSFQPNGDRQHPSLRKLVLNGCAVQFEQVWSSYIFSCSYPSDKTAILSLRIAIWCCLHDIRSESCHLHDCDNRNQSLPCNEDSLTAGTQWLLLSLTFESALCSFKGRRVLQETIGLSAGEKGYCTD